MKPFTTKHTGQYFVQYLVPSKNKILCEFCAKLLQYQVRFVGKIQRSRTSVTCTISYIIKYCGFDFNFTHFAYAVRMKGTVNLVLHTFTIVVTIMKSFLLLVILLGVLVQFYIQYTSGSSKTYKEISSVLFRIESQSSSV
jgi:hypothetical protein